MPLVPGVPGAGLPPNPFADDALIRRVQDLERAVRELSAANPLATAGLVPSTNKLTVQGELDVTGPMVVGGTLSLPAGIIGNDALANPVNFGGIGFSSTAFTVTTSSTAVITRTITIPTGFTQAAIIGVSTAGAINGSTSAGYLYIQTVVNGGGGSVMPAYGGPSGGWAFVCASAMRTLTGLTPGSITVATNLYASTAWGSNAANIANLDVIALFSR